MPEKLKWSFDNVTTPITMDLNDLLAGKQIEYLTDGKNWEEVTLIGFKTHTLSFAGFSAKGVYVEVLPLAGTNNLPIKVFHAERLRVKDAESTIKEIEQT